MRKYDEKTRENAANETTWTLMKGRGGFRFVLKSRHCGVNRLFCYTSLFLHCHGTDLRKGLCWELWAELLQIMLKYSPKLWICLLVMGAYFSHGIKKVCDNFFSQFRFFFFSSELWIYILQFFFFLLLLLLLQNSEEFCSLHKLAIVQSWLCSSELWVYILEFITHLYEKQLYSKQFSVLLYSNSILFYSKKKKKKKNLTLLDLHSIHLLTAWFLKKKASLFFLYSISIYFFNLL